MLHSLVGETTGWVLLAGLLFSFVFTFVLLKFAATPAAQGFGTGFRLQRQALRRKAARRRTLFCSRLFSSRPIIRTDSGGDPHLSGTDCGRHALRLF